MKILGLIPARAGSKGIPHKNKKKLGGKPLLQYTIEAALGASSLASVVFSSEDDELMELAERMGAKVPFKRPDHLATDAAGSLEVVQHALQSLEDDYDAVCLLQVTTPFRTSEDIDNAIERFKALGTDSLVSVQEVPHQYNPHWVFEEKEGVLHIATGEQQIIKRRQELPKAYIRDGAIYITKTEVLLKEHSFFGARMGAIELDSKRHVNIDTLEDWKKAEALLREL
ncbi:acylneuraminate cytidylyltransferase family protein [Aureisphaera galaxeae]|uniref:acylneuraminate cytidylyltransferase family protein n=1 Tax=Aureisphaera galaxeae TaxID=1538023 RepID=UPI0023501A3A|nr:acylneuraminate cytidylyltransferase family protein [Aureisphaera galaxeae]MDC8006298.1 acylneuraminate cytidylyltransferase family protein [Aureisphaera galaxeae]